MLVNSYKKKQVLMGRIDCNKDLLGEINDICNKNNIRVGHISIVGAIKSINLGYYLQDEQRYIYIDDIEKSENYEIVSCTGNVSIKDSKPFAHLHLIASDKNGHCIGGHLMPGTTVFAAEFVIQEFEGENLIRQFDKETGLPLWVKN